MAHSSVTFHYWIGIPLICGLLGISGCAGAKPPTGVVSQAELAVQQAGRSKAPEHARLELYTAREQLAGAKKALEAENYTQARRLAESALLQAQVAETKAEAEHARLSAEELRKSIESLRQETLRRTPGN